MLELTARPTHPTNIYSLNHPPQPPHKQKWLPHPPHKNYTSDVCGLLLLRIFLVLLWLWILLWFSFCCCCNYLLVLSLLLKLMLYWCCCIHSIFRLWPPVGVREVGFRVRFCTGVLACLHAVYPKLTAVPLLARLLARWLARNSLATCLQFACRSCLQVVCISLATRVPFACNSLGIRLQLTCSSLATRLQGACHALATR